MLEDIAKGTLNVSNRLPIQPRNGLFAPGTIRNFTPNSRRHPATQSITPSPPLESVKAQQALTSRYRYATSAGCPQRQTAVERHSFPPLRLFDIAGLFETPIRHRPDTSTAGRASAGRIWRAPSSAPSIAGTMEEKQSTRKVKEGHVHTYARPRAGKELLSRQQDHHEPGRMGVH